MAGQRNQEDLLRLNLNELAQDMARECGLACKKAGIYGPDHPAALKAAEKPFLAVRRFFDVRPILPLHLMRGKLSIAQVQLKETHLTDQFVQYVQMLDIFGILFDEKLSVRDLSVFLNSLTKRENRFAQRFDLGTVLKQQGVTTIEVNSERAMRFFESRKQYRGEIAGDFSVRHFLREQLPDEPLELAKLWKVNDSQLEGQGVDFRGHLVSHIQPEKIAMISRQSFETAFSQAQNDPALFATLQSMAAFHPDRHQFKQVPVPSQSPEVEQQDEITLIRKEARLQLDAAFEKAISADATSNDLHTIENAFERVIKTGQSEYAEQFVTKMITTLSIAENSVKRQSVLVLLKLLSLEQQVAGHSVFKSAIALIAELVRTKAESFEHGEIGVALIERFLSSERYPELVPLALALDGRIDRMLGVTTVDSPIVKRLRDTIHHPTYLEKVVQTALHGATPQSRHTALQLIGALRSEEVAMSLASQISHPERSVRQTVLKTLGEMGTVAESVCIDLLTQVRHFSTENPDRWYKIRNALNLLGHLVARTASSVLRPLVDDLDPRVRGELVLCLEKIKGEEEIDLLLECATDPDKEVRARAASALGAIGSRETVAPIIRILQEGHDIDCIRLVASLGRIGGDEAKQFLASALSDDELAQRLSQNISKDELRAAVIRALGTIADPDALSHVKRFSESIPFTQRLLLRSSHVGEALSEVLEKKS